jgi:hypothetical protein
MSWTTGTINSATPATALYTAIAAALTSWTFVETVPAATAGTTADVKVLRAPDNDWYLFIEVDDTNNRLRFRTAREYNTDTKQIRKHCPNTATGTNYIPAADYSATGSTWVNIGSTTSGAGGLSGVFYVPVFVVTNVGFNYYIGVGPGNGSPQDLILVATDVASAGSYGWALVGFFAPVNANDFPLFIAGSSGTGLTSEGTGTCRLAYEYGITTTQEGAFTGQFNIHGGTTTLSIYLGQPYGSARNPYTTNGIYVLDAVLHGNSSTGSTARFYRGHLPNFKLFYLASQVAPGDTITVGSTTYFVIGVSSTTRNVGICVNTALAF